MLPDVQSLQSWTEKNKTWPYEPQDNWIVRPNDAKEIHIFVPFPQPAPYDRQRIRTLHIHLLKG